MPSDRRNGQTPRLAILTAIPEEIAAFGAHLVETGRDLVAGVPIRLGTLDGRPVALAESGIGKVNAALAESPSVHFGTILTGDSYLGCGVTREKLFDRFAAKAIDMESGAVAQVANAFGAPWLIIRALSDLAGEDSRLDFQAFAAEAARKAAAAVLKSMPLFEWETGT